MENTSHTDIDKGEAIEHRKYIRLKVVFPVEFQFIDPETSGSISDIKQGFTRDVGKGGICLEVNNLEEGFEQQLKEQKFKLDLRLHIPLRHLETKAVARIAWFQKVKAGYPNKYLIGLEFLQIDPRDRDRIYVYARRIAITPKVLGIAFLFLILGLTYFYFRDIKLTLDNKKLVRDMVELSTKKSELEEKMLKFNKETKGLKNKISENETALNTYQKSIKDMEKLHTELRIKEQLIEHYKLDKGQAKLILKKVTREQARLHGKMSTLTKETEYLKNRLSRISTERTSVEDNLRGLISSFNAVEQKNALAMYDWIKNHQNRVTGLVMSYEGDKDLEDWAFTYDQSLASQCFILMGDKKNAQDIFDFYKHKAEKAEGGFTNAYDTFTGGVVEYSVRAGPNIWLGIAILHYTYKFKDEAYLSIAEDIAQWLIKLQNEDKEFGIRGGPNVTWLSTEHNLDAYAFFGMLYRITEEKKYEEAQKRVFAWLKKNAFNKKEGRFNRGKGDATIATDTFTWAIAALGPGLLTESDMDPDQIISFADANCLVMTDYKRPDGQWVKITGFDFGKYEHVPRGGIVSTEWTAQMVIALRVMSEYHRQKKDFEKSSYYKTKSEYYLSELEKMIISSPSRIGQGEGCLPYASQDNVDTGHGWRVAQGANTGSTAGTSYAIFAIYNYNPLMLD